MHYFYSVNKDLKCENFEPFCALYSNTELIGFGFISLGSQTNKDGGREWFEDAPTSMAKVIHFSKINFEYTTNVICDGFDL